MKPQDIRKEDPKELAQRVQELRAEYYALQEAVRLGKERNHARLPHLRRDIARHVGILREGK
jgi:ribosomal protein L29